MSDFETKKDKPSASPEKKIVFQEEKVKTPEQKKVELANKLANALKEAFSDKKKEKTVNRMDKIMDSLDMNIDEENVIEELNKTQNAEIIDIDIDSIIKMALDNLKNNNGITKLEIEYLEKIFFLIDLNGEKESLFNKNGEINEKLIKETLDQTPYSTNSQQNKTALLDDLYFDNQPADIYKKASKSKKLQKLEINKAKTFEIIRKYDDQLTGQKTIKFTPENLNKYIKDSEIKEAVQKSLMEKTDESKAYKMNETIPVREFILECVIQEVIIKSKKENEKIANDITSGANETTQDSYTTEPHEQVDEKLKHKEKIFTFLKDQGLVEGEFDQNEKINFDKAFLKLGQLYKDKKINVEEFIDEFAEVLGKNREDTRKFIEKYNKNLHIIIGAKKIKEDVDTGKLSADEAIKQIENNGENAFLIYAAQAGYSYSTIQSALDESRAKDEAEAKKKAEKETEAKKEPVKTQTETTAKAADLTAEQREYFIKNDPLIKKAPDFFRTIIRDKNTTKMERTDGDTIITMKLNDDVETHIIFPKDGETPELILNTKSKNGIKQPLKNFGNIENLVDTELSTTLIDTIPAFKNGFYREGQEESQNRNEKLIFAHWCGALVKKGVKPEEAYKTDSFLDIKSAKNYMTELFKYALQQTGVGKPDSLADITEAHLKALDMLDASGKMKNIEDLISYLEI